MKVWIDAEPAAARERLFGLGLIERTLRALARLKPAPDEIVVSGGPAVPAPKGLMVRHVAEAGPAGARLARFLGATGAGLVLVLDGRDVIDPRVLAALAATAEPRAVVFPDGAAAASIDAGATVADAADVAGAVRALIGTGRIGALDDAAVPSFIAHLRRDVPGWGFHLDDGAARARCARALFLANYKGSTDLLTKWVYPPLVWRLVLGLSAVRLHPNWVTVAGVVLALAAVPLFAAGAWVPGLICAYAMSVLDSVDGKLARLTLTDSTLGNVLDHGLDIVHPPLWYGAWAWALSNQGASEAVLVAGAWLVIVYVLDRLVLMIAKARFKRGLHSMTRLDGWVRTIIARRNVNLVILTVGLALGHGVAAFHVIVAWQVLTALWHGARTLILAARDPLSRARPAP